MSLDSTFGPHDVLRVATYNIHKGVQGMGPARRLEIHNLALAIENVYDIYPRWRHRYAPGVTRNREHVFGLCVPEGAAVRLNPREHTQFVWLPWRAAADRCFSPSNAEACLLLPRFAHQVTA